MEQKAPNIILLGDPAAGKGTQARWLARTYDLLNFDMGKEVRRPSARKKYDYAHTTGIGKLTPTWVARDILRTIIRDTPANEGILFNGHPKMIGEAHLTANLLKKYKRSDPVVIYLGIPQKEILDRVRRRRIVVHGRRTKRDDDDLHALENRERYYRDQVARVVTFFKKRYAFLRISGMGTRAQVQKRISIAIKKYVSKNKRGH